jgi:hypothetical protein
MHPLKKNQRRPRRHSPLLSTLLYPSPPMQSIYIQEPLQTNKNSPPAQPPSTPPRQTKAPETPPVPRPTRVRHPIGYHAALNEGQVANLAAEALFQPAESDFADEYTLTSHFGLAAVEPEVTLQQALNGPDAIEWQEAIDYKISQLEKLATWKVVDSPPGANLIPCHYVLATKRRPDGEKLKLHAR